MTDLKGTTAIVTGGTSGIGLATAYALLARGSNVVLNARTASRRRPRTALGPRRDDRHALHLRRGRCEPARYARDPRVGGDGNIRTDRHRRPFRRRPRPRDRAPDFTRGLARRLHRPRSLGLSPLPRRPPRARRPRRIDGPPVVGRCAPGLSRNRGLPGGEGLADRHGTRPRPRPRRRKHPDQLRRARHHPHALSQPR